MEDKKEDIDLKNKEEYYKMMAFQYEFSNGFRYTEEELKYFRERFYKYYIFNKDIKVLILEQKVKKLIEKVRDLEYKINKENK